MAAVVKDADLVAYMSDVRLPPAAAQILDTVIEGRQGDLEEYLGGPVWGDDYVTETVGLGASTYDSGRGIDTNPRLLTEQWPIAEVLAITDTAGTAVPYTLDRRGWIRLSGGDPYVGPYVVTYRPGLPPGALAQAKVAILNVVSREMQNRHDDTRSPSGVDGRPPAPLPEGWQPAELKRFSRFRRRGVFSRTRRYGTDVAAVTSGYGTSYGVVTAVDGALDQGAATSW